MARQTLTAFTAVGPYPALQPAANSLDLAFTAANATDKEEVIVRGPTLLIAQNTGAGARTVTVTSVADDKRRTGDITAYPIDAGEFAVLGPFNADGWMQSDGKLYFEASHSEVKWAVVRLPG